MMLNKVKSILIVMLSAIFCTLSVHADTADVTGEIQRFYVDGTGTVELIGYFDNTDLDYTSMLLTTDADLDTMTNENIMDIVMYIDQPPLGNNGAFYMRFPLNDKFSESPYVLRMNGGTLLTQTGTLREIPSEVYNISDNAIRIGNDVYDIGCKDYLPDNISKSIERGGNKIYYKIGGRWFDMLNENAYSWDYFTETNAIPEAEWSEWDIDTYYHY